MIYNSEIVITNDTPERGNVTGKRMRLTGTSGKLYAKTTNKMYKFERWEDETGQVLSTENPLVVSDWSARTINVVFGHVMLSDQMFADHDAIATQTWMLETGGPTIASRPYNGHGTPTYTYYTQGATVGPATRTANTGQVYQTNEQPYGYQYGDTSSNYTAYWDPAGVNPTTGVWLRSPDSFEFAPASGFPAENMDIGYTHPGEYHYPRRGRSGYYAPNTGYRTSAPSSYWYHPMYGITNNPTIGEPTQFPMWSWMPFSSVYSTSMVEYMDLTGLEHSQVVYVTNYHNIAPNAYNHVVNMDAAKYMHLRNVNFAHGRGMVSKSVYTADHHPSTHGVATTLHDTNGKYSPRLIDPLGYTKMRTFALKSQHYFRTSYDYSGPMDTKADPSTGEGVPNPHWVAESQQTPHSGSLLWSLRYAPVEDLRFTYGTPVADFSAFKHYYSNLKHLALNSPCWDGGGSTLFGNQSLPDLKGLKSLRSFQWYESYNHTSYMTDKPFDWSGLKDLKNLKTLYVYHSYNTYVKDLDLSYIPDSVKHLFIYPTPYLSEVAWPQETVLGAINFENNTIADRSLLSSDLTIHNNNALTIIST